MNKFVPVLILVLLLGINPTKILAANFINAYDAVGNSRLSSLDKEGNLTIQASDHIISVTATTAVKDGSIMLLIPAASADGASNDSQPDIGDEIINSGFDLNAMRQADVNCSLSGNSRTGSLNWSEAEIKPAGQTGSREHEITCKFQGQIVKGDKIEIKLMGEKKLVNPQPVKKHKSGQADIYPLKVLSLDGAGIIQDRIIMKVALIDAVVVTSGEVSANVGKYKFNLFGKTSPKAKVSLVGQTVKADTVADLKGDFLFSKPAPLFAQEICLISRDSQKRISPPVCLPPFPVSYDTNIGPVLMPPTISTDKRSYIVGEKGVLTGQTFPDTEVNLEFFKDEHAFYLVGPVEAYNIPNLKIKSDNTGFFSISLPTEEKSSFNFFAQSYYQDNPSPKSLTLNLRVNPWSSYLTNHIFGIIILWLILVLLFYFFKHFLHPEKIALMHYLHLIKLKRKTEIAVWTNNRAIIKRDYLKDK